MEYEQMPAREPQAGDVVTPGLTVTAVENHGETIILVLDSGARSGHRPNDLIYVSR